MKYSTGSWWFWHLLYDNPFFGPWLWRRVRQWQWEREFGAATWGIYGVNQLWQLQQRNRIIAEDGRYKLLSPASRI